MSSVHSWWLINHGCAAAVEFLARTPNLISNVSYVSTGDASGALSFTTWGRLQCCLQVSRGQHSQTSGVYSATQTSRLSIWVLMVCLLVWPSELWRPDHRSGGRGGSRPRQHRRLLLLLLLLQEAAPEVTFNHKPGAAVAIRYLPASSAKCVCVCFTKMHELSILIVI